MSETFSSGDEKIQTQTKKQTKTDTPMFNIYRYFPYIRDRYKDGVQKLGQQNKDSFSFLKLEVLIAKSLYYFRNWYYSECRYIFKGKKENS